MQTVSSLTEGRTKVISSNSLFTVPLFSLRSPSSARDKKKNRRRYIDRQRKGVRVGKKNIGSSLFFFLTLRTCSCALTDVFEKNEQATVQNHIATQNHSRQNSWRYEKL